MKVPTKAEGEAVFFDQEHPNEGITEKKWLYERAYTKEEAKEIYDALPENGTPAVQELKADMLLLYTKGYIL